MDKETIITNLEVELKRGTQIVQVLYFLKQEQYGYSLLQALEHKGITIEAGTLYPLLRRLETQGMLISKWDTSEARPRKYYQLNDLGISVLNHLISTWKKMNEDMMSLFEEEKI